VPRMLLQPLVENAVRHGVALLVEGGAIRIENRVIGKQLPILVANASGRPVKARRADRVLLPIST
jgi:two-component system, LytTR family, sensor kinase